VFKRALWLCVGLGAGLAFGYLAFRKAYLTTKRYAPGPTLDRWADRLSQAWREGNKAFREREGVLWDRIEAGGSRRPR
jgi:hypothetical protein